MSLFANIAALHGFILAVSVLTALMEIQIEGRHGFAVKLPTWRYRSKLYSKLTNGKELTGYHLYLNLLLFVFFHFAFLFSQWTLAGELLIVSGFVLYIPFWDFLWFVFNPAFGWKKYMKENIWWFKKWYGLFPEDYYICIFLSGLLMFLMPLTTQISTWNAQNILTQSFDIVSTWLLSLCLFLIIPTIIITATVNMLHRAPEHSLLSRIRKTLLA